MYVEQFKVWPPAPSPGFEGQFCAFNSFTRLSILANGFGGGWATFNPVFSWKHNSDFGESKKLHH